MIFFLLVSPPPQHFLLSQYERSAPLMFQNECEELKDSLKYEIIALESRYDYMLASRLPAISNKETSVQNLRIFRNRQCVSPLVCM